MIANTPRATSALMSLLTAVAAFAALTVAVPVGAEVRSQHVNDRIAELCTASDVDLVGKRIARQCRTAIRAQVEEEQRLASAKSPSKVRVALRK